MKNKNLKKNDYVQLIMKNPPSPFNEGYFYYILDIAFKNPPFYKIKDFDFDEQEWIYTYFGRENFKFIKRKGIFAYVQGFLSKIRSILSKL